MSALNTGFLKDIMLLSFSAFGGPSAHIALALEHLVRRKNYLTEDELVELMALCSMLPGPTSTQTITSIGYKLGGPKLALMTLMTWVLPAVVGMSILSYIYLWFTQQYAHLNIFRYLLPVAVGFVVYAAYKIGKKVIKNEFTGILFFVSGVIAVLIRAPWIFPVLLIAGGFISNFISKAQLTTNTTRPKIRWIYLILFAVIFLAAVVLAQLTKHPAAVLFESFYRFGSLIFGGGQVLIPIMQTELVDAKGYLTNESFLTGYGLVQAMPGPVFSFSAFAGGLALRDTSQLLGCLLGAVAIFLPGTLLIFFVYPVWEWLKQYAVIQRAMPGVNAAAGGLILAAVYILGASLEVEWWSYALVVATFFALEYLKISGILIVLAAILLGVVI